MKPQPNAITAEDRKPTPTEREVGLEWVRRIRETMLPPKGKR